MKKRNKKLLGKAKRRIFRKANAIFIAIILIGIGLLGSTAFTGYDGLLTSSLWADGIAFIIAGFVGVVMSMFSQEIGNSIKNAITTEGQNTRNVITGAITTEGQKTRNVITGAITTEGQKTRNVITGAITTEG
ncbi:MAG: hypothetical protein OXC46_07800, partial [Thaumarchaeota archaeon]|nr:hypothetical protein [Nitrososphaerota archaeon]